MVTRKHPSPPTATVDLCTHFGLHHLPFTREVAVADRWPHPQYDTLADQIRAIVEHRLSAAIVSAGSSPKRARRRPPAIRAAIASRRRAQVRVVMAFSAAGACHGPTRPPARGARPRAARFRVRGA